MQINGVGGGSVHNHNMHQVTDCNHEHTVSKKESGGAAASARKSLQSDVKQYSQQQQGFSMASWWKKLLAGGQKLFTSLWGESPAKDVTTTVEGDKGLKNSPQVMAPMGVEEDGSTDIGQTVNAEAQEAMAGAVQPQHTLHNNPYFSAIEDTGRQKQTLWDKVRVRFQSVAGQLTGRSSKQNSFQAKQQKSKEDLRKHSRYREDDLEIDCILTDDSYLLDSYDSKGAYSKLSPKK